MRNFLFFLIIFFVVPAHGASNLTATLRTAEPTLSMVASGSTGVEVRWNWDTVSAGYKPPLVTRVVVDLTTDGLNYPDSNRETIQMDTPPPFVFSVDYPSLNPGTYTARVSIIDGNDLQYVVGSVEILGGGKKIVVGIGDGADGDTGVTPLPGVVIPRITLSGLAFPSPAKVLMRIDAGQESAIDPDSQGRFTFQSSTIATGTRDFFFRVKDPRGTHSQQIAFSKVIVSGVEAKKEDLFFSPTIAMCDTKVRIGQILEVTGYGYRGGKVSLSIEGPKVHAGQVRARTDGSWVYQLPMTGFPAGSYTVSAESESAGGDVSSPSSSRLSFTVLPLRTYQVRVRWDWNHISPGFVPANVREVQAEISSDGLVYTQKKSLPPSDFSARFTGLSAGVYAARLTFISNAPPLTQFIGPIPVGGEELNVSCFKSFQIDQPGGSTTPASPALPTEIGTSSDISFTPLELSLTPETASPTSPGQTSGQTSDETPVAEDTPTAPTFTPPPVDFPPVGGDVEFVCREAPALVKPTLRALEVTVLPESRVPSKGNFSTEVCLELLDPVTGNLLSSLMKWTNADGKYTTSLASPESMGPFDLRVKGRSHLSTRLKGFSFGSGSTIIDFSGQGRVFLTAGDVNTDDVINALDISVLNTVLDTGSKWGDQNADGIVNALDLSITLKNLDKVGDRVSSL